MDRNIIHTNEYTIQVDNLFVTLFTTFALKIESEKLLSAAPHAHSYTELFACKTGSIHIKAEDNIYTLHSGDVAIVPSGLMHQTYLGHETDSIFTCIGIMCSECHTKTDKNLYQKISNLIDGKNILTFADRHDFSVLIENISSTTPNTCDPWHLMDFVSALSKLTVMLPAQNTSAKYTEHQLENMDRLLKIDYYIHYSFMNEVSNTEVANELHISERQLSRLVLAQYGTTLHTQIYRKRIAVAAKLLTESSDSIESIAFSVGFKSKMGFYREFKKIYHMTPAQFRVHGQSKED